MAEDYLMTVTRNWSDDEAAQATALREAGLTYELIAQRMRRSRGSVASMLNRRCVEAPLRRPGAVGRRSTSVQLAPIEPENSEARLRALKRANDLHCADLEDECISTRSRGWVSYRIPSERPRFIVTPVAAVASLTGSSAATCAEV